MAELRHIGAMQMVDDNNRCLKTALLSAVPPAGGQGNFAAATADICGIPFIALQIRQLQSLGFVHFLVETEQLSGAFLATVDQLKQQGTEIDVIRSPQDLAKATNAVQRLLVIGPGVHVERQLLEDLLREADPFIATVDGRDENAVFERIDLNTRWVGIASVDRAALQEIASLPEGWSLTSAILRSALQSVTRQIQFQQKEIENNNIKIINDDVSINNLKRAKLAHAGNAQSGLMESALYSPLTNWAIMKLPFDLSWANIAAITFSALALFTGFFGLLWIAAISGILAILLLVAMRNLYDISHDRSDKLFSDISWGLLIVALLLVCFEYEGTNAAFSALIVTALLRYSSLLGAGSDRLNILMSPALLSWVLCLGAVLVEFNTVLQIFAILQLGALLFAQLGLQRKKQS